jgi:tetratricopeptide (TPR) repeat protein
MNAEQEVEKCIHAIEKESAHTYEFSQSAPQKVRITSYNIKKLILEMLHLIHYAGSQHHLELTQKIFELVKKIPFNNHAFYKADILHHYKNHLGELGFTDEIRNFMYSLMQQEEILGDCYNFELTFSTLYHLLGDSIFELDFRKWVLKVNYEALNVISIPHLDAVISYYGTEFAEELMQGISKLSFEKRNYVLLMIRTCILDRLSQEGKTEEGFALIQDIFKEIFSKKIDFQDAEVRDECRQLLLKRLIDKLSGFGNIQKGIPQIKAILESLSKFKDVGPQGEVLTRIAHGLSQLGSSEEAFQILNNILRMSKDIIERRDPHYLICFKVLALCIQSLEELGEDSERCLLVVDAAYKILQEARRKIKTLNRYYLSLAEFRCGYEFVRLGREEQGYEIIEDLLNRITEFGNSNIDSIEFMQEIVRVSPYFSEQFSTKILEHIFQELHKMGQGKEDLMFVEYATKLIEICIEDVIQGEPLFKSELAKFQGNEERIIRQRLVCESITS